MSTSAQRKHVRVGGHHRTLFAGLALIAVTSGCGEPGDTVSSQTSSTSDGSATESTALTMPATTIMTTTSTTAMTTTELITPTSTSTTTTVAPTTTVPPTTLPATTTAAPTTTVPPTTTTLPFVAAQPLLPQSDCDLNYEGACVPIASDVDCAGGSGNGPAYVDGPVYVVGNDVYGLDGNDNDGVGCE